MDTDAITAVVLGGIAMTGGTGTMFGTFLGLLVLLTLNNGLLVLGVTTYWQNVAKGVVLVFALAAKPRPVSTQNLRANRACSMMRCCLKSV